MMRADVRRQRIPMELSLRLAKRPITAQTCSSPFKFQAGHCHQSQQTSCCNWLKLVVPPGLTGSHPDGGSKQSDEETEKLGRLYTRSVLSGTKSSDTRLVGLTSLIPEDFVPAQSQECHNAGISTRSSSSLKARCDL
jgi:hypothetical protein